MAIFGLGQQKPRHYREMARVVWENRDQLPFAWRILKDGVCDGCALGTSGLSDWTLDGVHLCMVRLELMRLNTAPPLDPSILMDVAPLARRSSQELRALGRLPEPMLRRAGDPGFTVVSWDEALDRVAMEIRAVDPARLAFYLTSRGTTNEVYYAAQKAARFFGTNHIDNSARLCHAASTAAMKSTLGYGASTCSYSDWLHADLIVLFGSNVANNQPVSTKYLYHAKKNGAQIAVVNPYREPGLERYWIPSIGDSALRGTPLTDHWFEVETGGDLAFLNGVFRALIELGGVDEKFVGERTTGFSQARAHVEAMEWAQIERGSGMSRDRIVDFARLLIDRPKAIFVWSMGLTQHAHGVDTIKSLVNVGLARGLVGRPNRGLVPIRGHSGVQGGAEVGCVPKVDRVTAARWTKVWGFQVPDTAGWTASEMVEHAARGEVDLFWMLGGNFLETLADVERSREALRRPRLRVHQDIVFSSSMLVDGGDVLLLPAATRYESPGGGTETSTERRIIFSPEIPGRRIGSARPEWWVFREVMARARPELRHLVGLDDATAIRQEIARTVPLYKGIETLRAKGDQVQWGGPTLYINGHFATPDGKAHFSLVVDGTRPTGRRGHVHRVHAPRQAVQLHGAAPRRPADRRGARRHLHQRRGHGAARAGSGRGRAAAIGVRHVQRAAEGGAHQAWQPGSALAGGHGHPVERGHRSGVDGTGLQRGRDARRCRRFSRCRTARIGHRLSGGIRDLSGGGDMQTRKGTGSHDRVHRPGFDIADIAIARMSDVERIGEGIKRGVGKLPPALQAQLSELITPQALAVAGGFFVAWLVSHAVGIGFVVDAILLGVGALAIGLAVFAGIDELIQFGNVAIAARSHQDMDRAATHFAMAVSILGVQAVIALFLRRAPQTFRGTRIRIGPPPGGGVVMKPGLRGVKSMQAGVGETSAWGEITISRLGTSSDRQLAPFTKRSTGH